MLNGRDVLTVCDIQKELNESVDDGRDVLVKEYAIKWLIPFAALAYFLYQAVILLLMRYLQTSCTDLAIKKGDPPATSPVYLTDNAMLSLFVGRGRQHRPPALRQLRR